MSQSSPFRYHWTVAGGRPVCGQSFGSLSRTVQVLTYNLTLIQSTLSHVIRRVDGIQAEKQTMGDALEIADWGHFGEIVVRRKGKKGRDSGAEGSRSRSRQTGSYSISSMDFYFLFFYCVCVMTCQQCRRRWIGSHKLLMITDTWLSLGRSVIFLTIRNRVFIVAIDGACTRPRHSTRTKKSSNVVPVLDSQTSFNVCPSR